MKKKQRPSPAPPPAPSPQVQANYTHPKVEEDPKVAKKREGRIEKIGRHLMKL